ncbi:hypothetical protein F4779DRAFT_17552 [Xylariaceae sp. FL0662B]|nr:hypothetical protein F4779DRAFT_17552 [Xylariaceae sp. FL0662B]
MKTKRGYDDDGYPPVTKVARRTGDDSVKGGYRRSVASQENRIWYPNMRFGQGMPPKEIFRDMPGTRRNPRIFWLSKPEWYDWKEKLDLSGREMLSYRLQHELIARRECLRFGWCYVWIRKELHSTTDKGKRITVPHITVYLGTSYRYQLEGHWYCYENERRPGYPIAIMEDGDAKLPARFPSRHLYAVISEDTQDQLLPREWTPKFQPPRLEVFNPIFREPIPEMPMRTSSAPKFPLGTSNWSQKSSINTTSVSPEPRALRLLGKAQDYNLRTTLESFQQKYSTGSYLSTSPTRHVKGQTNGKGNRNPAAVGHGELVNDGYHGKSSEEPAGSASRSLVDNAREDHARESPRMDVTPTGLKGLNPPTCPRAMLASTKSGTRAPDSSPWLDRYEMDPGYTRYPTGPGRRIAPYDVGPDTPSTFSRGDMGNMYSRAQA